MQTRVDEAAVYLPHSLYLQLNDVRVVYAAVGSWLAPIDCLNYADCSDTAVPGHYHLSEHAT